MASPTSCLCGSGVSAPVNAKTDALLAVTLRHALTGFNHTCQGAVHDHIQIVVTDRAKVRLIHGAADLEKRIHGIMDRHHQIARMRIVGPDRAHARVYNCRCQHLPLELEIPLTPAEWPTTVSAMNQTGKSLSKNQGC